MQLFLGIDVGTQSLKLCVLEFSTGSPLRVTFETQVHYDEELPQYKTKNGVLENEITGEVLVDPLLWVDAFDLSLTKMKKANVEIEKIVCISGSAQQHGSVFWKKGSQNALRSTGNETLSAQLEGCFTCLSPIWMDSSTTKICQKMETAVGGKHQLAKLTGSRAYERFTGCQIAKRLHACLNGDSCERISLISSFFSTLLLPHDEQAPLYAPIDLSDGSGMNLLDINSCQWSNEAVEAMIQSAPQQTSLLISNEQVIDLLGKKVVDSPTVLSSRINEYFVNKYGFSKETQIVAFSGDNCNSACFTLRRPGDVTISLGTSHVAFEFVDKYSPNADEGHVFLSPLFNRTSTKAESYAKYLPLVCIKNGGIVRDVICKKTCITESAEAWSTFNSFLDSSKPGNEGSIGFYYLHPECTPQTGDRKGFFRFGPNDEPIEQFQTPQQEVRALVEFQCLSLRIHAKRVGMGLNSKRLVVTGGAARNKSILQVLANVFGAPVFVIPERENSAALGAAIRAMHSFYGEKLNVFELLDAEESPFKLTLVATPDVSAVEVYKSMEPRFEKLEQRVLELLAK